jgi:hypothetical protein
VSGCAEACVFIVFWAIRTRFPEKPKVVANYKNSQKSVKFSGFGKGKCVDFSREGVEGSEGGEAFGETLKTARVRSFLPFCQE